METHTLEKIIKLAVTCASNQVHKDAEKNDFSAIAEPEAWVAFREAFENEPWLDTALQQQGDQLDLAITLFVATYREGYNVLRVSALALKAAVDDMAESLVQARVVTKDPRNSVVVPFPSRPR